ncbi:MAG: sigma-70 family RNA polymerase sigma factor [Planctomycetales bacterium]|nr:sigma-70 family RNA polymerase sigma factor [Planctomycetales bacterium]
MTYSQQKESNEPADEIVSLARTDRAAFGELFDFFYPHILAYCVRRLIMRAVAEDVTSEVFLKVAQGIRVFPGVCVEDFRRWIFRIATNEINAYLRQTIRRRELFAAAAEMGRISANVSQPLLGDVSQIDWQDLYRALECLTEREQAIISLRFFGGLKHHQIADVLDLKPGTIRVALCRALDCLRDRLRGDDVARRSASDAARRL